jgi:RHS repeat-associated protein
VTALTDPDIVTNITGNVFLPQTPELLLHDADGNLTNDGRWVYAWDAENRLISMTALTNIPSGAKIKLEFAYDYRNRRIKKKAANWTGAIYSPTSARTFVYDEWNLVAELNDTEVMRSFIWSTDLTGGSQSGSVGGLVLVRESTNVISFPAFDGNANVIALVSATGGEITSRYEYGPFGELIQDGAASANPFLFSTKFFDSETCFYYYGYRYYDPLKGHWINRDSLGELGGKNLYGFVANDPISRFDPLGLKDYRIGNADPTIKPDVGAGTWDSKEWTWSNVALKQLIVDNIGIVWIGMPDAVNHVQHYFWNSGTDYTIRLQKMIDSVPSAKRVYNNEIAMAQEFVESLKDGKHQITSGTPSGSHDGAYNRESESKNWYFAVGGLQRMGQGKRDGLQGRIHAGVSIQVLRSLQLGRRQRSGDFD